MTSIFNLVRNVQPGQTLLISNGSGNYQIAETNGATPTLRTSTRPSSGGPAQIKTVRRVQPGTTGQTVNGQTLRIVQQSPNTTPRPVRQGPQSVRRLIPIQGSSNQGGSISSAAGSVQGSTGQKSGNVTRLVPVTNVITRIPNTNPNTNTPTQTQVNRINNPSIQVQSIREPVTPGSATQIRPLRTRVVATSPAVVKNENPPRARVSGTRLFTHLTLLDLK